MPQDSEMQESISPSIEDVSVQTLSDKKLRKNSRGKEMEKIDAAVRRIINYYEESDLHPELVNALREAALRGDTFEEIQALADLVSADGVAAVGMPRAVGETHNIGPLVDDCEKLNQEIADKQAEIKKEADADAEKNKERDTSYGEGL